MSRSRRSPLTSILSLVLIVLIVVTAYLVFRLPSQAEALYGPPVGQLSLIDHLWLSFKLLMNQQVLLTPIDPAAGTTSFQIESGESAVTIANHLQTAGLIADANAWLDYLVYCGLDTRLQAGRYILSQALSPVGIAQFMQDPNSHEIPFAVLPGWRLEEIAATLPTSGLMITPEEFLAFTRTGDGSNLDGRLPAGLPSLEGYLMPGEYAFIRGITLPEFLAVILDHFFVVVSSDLQQAFAAQGLDLNQAIILASMVEREAILDEEMPVISSVFLNRLAAGMRLESDPTVQYALGYDVLSNKWWKVPLAAEDLIFGSAYNTYLYGGLPPAPICNPGEEALLAVAYPEHTNYYFFRAKCDGSGGHNFSETYEGHQANACN